MHLARRGARLSLPFRVQGCFTQTSPARLISRTLREFSSQPLTDNVTGQVTFVNYKGEKVTLTGFFGQNLLEVCQLHGARDILDDDGGGHGAPSQVIRSDTWTEDVFGAGPTSKSCHIIVPHAWYAKLPKPNSEELWVLDELDAEVRTDTSRLASEIRLTKELDGLTVYVPDPFPSDIP